MVLNPWPVNWSAAWVGALASFSTALILGLIATTLGGATPNPFDFHKVALISLIGVIVASFFAGAAGGWVAGKISGHAYSEPSILHATIAWAITLPMLLAALASGAGDALGGWYGGLHAVSPVVATATTAANTPDTLRNTSLAALTSILVSLVGAVVGGWMASGEPMTFGHHRTRTLIAPPERRPL
ncbi:MAG: hypothetical protein JO349_00835 [Candidatus Eremiobacteraeota bacterium]|nr:hypothetical protein [Candidatus Eremiobacteraeota bacterium]